MRELKSEYIRRKSPTEHTEYTEEFVSAFRVIRVFSGQRYLGFRRSHPGQKIAHETH